MYKVMIVAKRRAGMSMEDFVDHYETRHAQLGQQMFPTMTRYVRNYLTAQMPRPGEQPVELPYDVVTEIEFDDEASFRRSQEYARRPDLLAEAVADEENLFDRSTVAMVHVETRESDLSG